MNDAELKKVLAAHKGQIEDVHGQYSALETIVVGFMLALQDRSTDPEVFKEAFDYAERIHTLSADRHPGALQTIKSLQVVEDLRKAVIAHRSPSK